MSQLGCWRVVRRGLIFGVAVKAPEGAGVAGAWVLGGVESVAVEVWGSLPGDRR